jgi:hypothetical protein
VGLAQEREEGNLLGCARKRKGPSTGPLQGRKGDSTRGTLGKLEYLFLFSNLFTICKQFEFKSTLIFKDFYAHNKI